MKLIEYKIIYTNGMTEIIYGKSILDTLRILYDGVISSIEECMKRLGIQSIDSNIL